MRFDSRIFNIAVKPVTRSTPTVITPIYIDLTWFLVRLFKGINNVTPFSIDDSDNAYTFSKVGINTGNPSNYNLTVNGTTNITGDTTLEGDLYMNKDKIHVQDGELYFNNQ